MCTERSPFSLRFSFFLFGNTSFGETELFFVCLFSNTSRVSSEGTWIWAIQEPFRPPNLAPSTISIQAIMLAGGLFTVVPWRYRQRKSEKFLRVCRLQSTLLQPALPTTTGTRQAILPPSQQPALSLAPSSCKMAITAATLGAPPAG